MRTYFLSLTIFAFTSYSFAQQQLAFFDPVENLNEAISKYSEGNYDEALKVISNIHESDTLYDTYKFIEISCYFDNGDYEKVVEMVNRTEPFTGFDHSYRIKKGVALLRLERFEESKTCFDELIELYPTSYIAYYNRGICHIYMEEYENSIKDYQRSILLNPFYATAHLELGKICYNEHLHAQAMMCFNSFLLLDPDGEESLGVLSFLNSMVSEKNESDKRGIKISEDDDAFAEIDLLISNYTALSDRYKVKNDIDLPLVKQNHAMMELLATFEGNGGFWDKKYVPFYREVFSTGNFDPFIYYIMSSTNSEKYSKIVSKHKKDTEEFVEWAAPLWTATLRKNNEYKELEDVDFSYYEDGECSAIGKENENGNLEGTCFFFTEEGRTTATGKFKNEKREGEWNWFHPDGSIAETVTYINGEPEGDLLKYNKEGYLIARTEYKNGLINGKEIVYNDFGVISEETNYINDVAEGNSYIYHPLGKDYVSTEIPFSNNEIDGVARTFYSNGQVELQVEIRDGKRIGEEKHYYSNGQIIETYSYVDGEINGDYIKYFDNGPVMEKGQYTSNIASGEWTTFHLNENISTVGHYNDKGRLHGDFEYYSKTGKLISRYKYDKGEFVSCIFFDPENSPIHEITGNKKGYRFESYYLNANLQSEGDYGANYIKTGVWNYYNRYGQIISKEDFIDGKLTGTDVEYFTGDAVQTEMSYKNGEANGEYREYYPDGTLKSNGYYINNKAERIWLYYFPDGTLAREVYYSHDNPEGEQWTYSPEGKVFSMDLWRSGNHIESVYYDTAGKRMETVNYYDDTLVELHFPNGKLRKTGEYLNGIPHGMFKWYYINGQEEVSGKIFDGSRTGEWKWYYDDGTLNTRGTYYDGKREGEWISYHENGNTSYKRNYFRGDLHGPYYSYTEDGVLNFETNYVEGEHHGVSKFYSEHGDLQVARYYNYGYLTGYSYPDETGSLKPEILLKDGTGKILAYHDDGTKAREYEVYKGEIHGVYSTYFKNQKLASRGEYTYGIRNGRSEVYFESGKPKIVSNYLNDVEHGEFILYYPSGQIKKEALYKNGILSGWAKFYNEDGTLKKKEFYFNDLIYDAVYYE